MISMVWVSPTPKIMDTIIHAGLLLQVTIFPKVIWEQAALPPMPRHPYAPKITPSRGPISKPNYLPHPWTYPTYANRIHIRSAVLPQCTGQTDTQSNRRFFSHPYPISRFATMHQTDRYIDRATNCWEEMFDDYRPLSVYRERRSLLTSFVSAV